MKTTRNQNDHDRVIAVIQENAASLLRLARQHSICADDAQDAYQRTLEIYLERIDRVDHATVGQYLRTIVKHEAMRIRDSRQRVVSGSEVDFDAHVSTDFGDAADRLEGFERVARAAEALQSCKPDEVRALLLKADGSSYAEIGELLGWTYTKVNRSLTEGRARFLDRFAEIEEGSACERWASTLFAIVDGEASSEDVAAVRPHLRHCSACRATLRSLYEAQPALGAIVPVGGLVAGVSAAPDAPGLLTRAYEAAVTGAGERLMRLQAVFEALTSTKGAAVVASTAAVAGGGVGAAALQVERGAAKAQREPAREAVVKRDSPAPAAAPVTTVAERAPVITPRPAERPATRAPAPATVATPTPTPRREFAIEAPKVAPPAVPAARAAPTDPPPRAPAGKKAGGEFGFEG